MEVVFLKIIKLLPEASFEELKNRKHFAQNSFPEIVREVRKIIG